MKYDPAQTKSTHFDVTELRVHGVGGSTPEALLGVPQVTRVAGTKRAGFYRTPAWITLEAPKRNLEGYSWGGFTSSSVLRVLWILLLPFALINLVGWMFPNAGNAMEPGSRTTKDSTVVGAFRLLGLTATLATVAFGSLITIQMIGIECVTGEVCLDRWYLLPWRWVDTVGQGIAVGSAVAVAFVLVMGFIARLGQARRDDIDRERRDDPVFETTLIGNSSGDAHALWDRSDVADRLGLAHTSAAIVMVGLFCIEAISSTSEVLLRSQLIVLSIAGVVVLVLVAWLPLASSNMHRGLLGVVTLAFIWTAAAAYGVSPGVMDDQPLKSSVYSVFGALSVAFSTTGLIALGRRLSGGERPLDRIFLLFPALLLVVAVGAGTMGVAADRVSDGFDLSYANQFAIVGLAWLLGAVTALVFYRFSHESRPMTLIAAEYGIGIVTGRDRRFLKRIQSAEASAALTDKLGWVLAAGLLFSLPVLMFVVVMTLANELGPFTPLATLVENTEPYAGRAVIWLVVLGVGLMGWMIRDPNARRGFGIIWDVATFWPRWFHPWAPPSYGEFAVPHLQARLVGLVELPEAVVLSTHSQGSVIGAAALAGLPRHQLQHVRWISHGCPLDRLYATYFPEYFDAALFADLRAKLVPEAGEDGWCNLWRRTDYIGGPVQSEVDVAVMDPESAETVLDIDPRPRPSKHSNFYSTQAYNSRLRKFVADLAQGTPEV